MAATTARNQQDVDSMDKRARLYDSLSYTYGKRGEKISQEFDKARSQADRQALSRGMQRSSYNNQTLAGIDRQRIEALEDNESALIADYENRLADIEQQEQAADQWERQFAENQRQYNTSLNFQQAEADRAQKNTEWGQAFQERQYGDSRADVAWNQAFQTQQANQAASQWEREFARSGDDTGRQIAMSYISQIAANGGDPSDDLLRQAGLSRADYNAMRAQIIADAGAVSGGGYSGRGSSGKESAGTAGTAGVAGAAGGIMSAYNGLSAPVTDSSLNDALYGSVNGGTSEKNYSNNIRPASPLGGKVKPYNYVV